MRITRCSAIRIVVLTLLVGVSATLMGHFLAVRLTRIEAQSSAGWDINLLARVVAAEAQGEPFAGQVGVAAVILNRVRHPSFPNTLSGVIYQPHAFESVTNGLIWRRTPDAAAVSASRQAINGWDPTYGAVFFWNPGKPVSPWIWSRQIIAHIGQHVFAR
ncbi:MAG: cell wall hydrolase [Limnochordia bacterium]